MKSNYNGTGERGMGGTLLVGLIILIFTIFEASQTQNAASIIWIMCAVGEFFVALAFIGFLQVYLTDQKTVKHGRKDYGVIKDAYADCVRRGYSYTIIVSYTTDSGAKGEFYYHPDYDQFSVYAIGKRVAIYVYGNRACMDPEKADSVFEPEKKHFSCEENKPSEAHPIDMDVMKDE